MNKAPARTVNIVPGHQELSREQQAFNTLIARIESRRARLAAWEAAILPYQQKYSGKLRPLIEDRADLQVRLVHCLDRAGDQLGKAERRAISKLIADLLEQLAGHREDADLAALHDRHCRQTPEDANAVSAVEAVPEAAQAGGEEESPEAMVQRVEAQLEAERQAREARPAARKKPSGQSTAEARRAAETLQASQSIREVYRKLASALHPDRETDPGERERKTALMQRVNQAYDRKNLLELLELQRTAEHIDPAAINSLGAERLKHYNRILAEQLGELDQEIRLTESRFRARFGIAPGERLAPDTLLRQLNRDIAGMRQLNAELKVQLRAFEDLGTLKAWLREQR